MKFYNAKVVDILRSHQRDEAFANELNAQIDSILKLFGLKFYNKHRNNIDRITTLWYYVLTSGSNLQTLGEEYAGILRVTSGNKLPAAWTQVLWIALFIGSENLFDRLLRKMRENVAQSTSLLSEPKDKLLQILSFLIDNKHILIRLHQAIFYMYGKYYNISNRLTGIKYVLLRDWMQDRTSIKGLKILGYCYFLYLIIYLLKYTSNEKVMDNILMSNSSFSSKTCSLCGENRKNTSSTPCGHLYCWECIHKCIKYSAYCPACREAIHMSRIVYLQNYN